MIELDEGEEGKVLAFLAAAAECYSQRNNEQCTMKKQSWL